MNAQHKLRPQTGIAMCTFWSILAFPKASGLPDLAKELA